MEVALFSLGPLRLADNRTQGDIHLVKAAGVPDSSRAFRFGIHAPKSRPVTGGGGGGSVGRREGEERRKEMT